MPASRRERRVPIVQAEFPVYFHAGPAFALAKEVPRIRPRRPIPLEFPLRYRACRGRRGKTNWRSDSAAKFRILCSRRVAFAERLSRARLAYNRGVRSPRNRANRIQEIVYRRCASSDNGRANVFPGFGGADRQSPAPRAQPKRNNYPVANPITLVCTQISRSIQFHLAPADTRRYPRDTGSGAIRLRVRKPRNLVL